MYVFKIKLYDEHTNNKKSFAFPSKSPKKRGTTCIKKYKGSGELGWFKCKKQEDAEKGFIYLLKYTISDIQSPFTRANPKIIRPYGNYASCSINDNEADEKKANLKFLTDLMLETEIRYLDKYPENFI